MDDGPFTDDLDLTAVTTREQLASLLEALRARADRPSLRKLERWAQQNGKPALSKSTVADMLSGRRFPRKTVLLTFLEACAVPDGEVERWQRAWERIAPEENRRPEVEPADLDRFREQVLEQAHEAAEAILTGARGRAEQIIAEAEQRLVEAETLRRQAQADAAAVDTRAPQAEHTLQHRDEIPRGDRDSLAHQRERELEAVRRERDELAARLQGLSAAQARRARPRATAVAAPRILAGHAKPVVGLAFHPDGRLLATAGADGTVRLWDTVTHDPVGDPITGHSGLYEVAFHPDGRLLASVDGTVRLWDPATGEPVGRPLEHGGRIDSDIAVAFHPQGHLLVTGSVAGKVRLWDPATGEPLGRFGSGGSPVKAVAFHPDGSLLASVDRTVRLWDPATMESIGEPFMPYPGPLHGLAFHPQRHLLVAVGDDGGVHLRDLETGREVLRHPRQPLSSHVGAVRGAAFHPGGDLLVTTGADGTARLWDPATGEPLGEPLSAHTGTVYAVAFHPDGRWFATANEDATIRLWSTPKWADHPVK
ncbi:hypothetical protein [Microbispora sp. H10885]|uniref:hypothetical protein n=1 Tax=Microbispora sp. H10885 TaxID=2729110 RepID=UPI00160352E5|nr:hypothetical protein [Microbispora sp. H10885]